MPAPKNPNLPEFYVYRLKVSNIPFYVGVGRAERASDRLRFVRWLMDRERRGFEVKWTPSNEVVAKLLDSKCKVSIKKSARGLIRDEALAREKEEIARLLAKGYVLANIHHNPNRLPSASAMAKAIRAQLKSAKKQ